MITIRNRGRLPHWEENRAIYFVTFRLADSLPQNVLKQIDRERQDIVATAEAMHRDLTSHEHTRLASLFTEKIEAHLDSGAGACHLTRPPIADGVAQALRHFADIRYRLHAWCVMPNHVHVVFQPLAGHTLARIVHGWKSFTAKEANRQLGRSGSFWQREYYDHLVRDEGDLRRVVRYVLENPRRAGLRDWRWISERPPA